MATPSCSKTKEAPGTPRTQPKAAGKSPVTQVASQDKKKLKAKVSRPSTSSKHPGSSKNPLRRLARTRAAAVVDSSAVSRKQRADDSYDLSQRLLEGLKLLVQGSALLP